MEIVIFVLFISFIIWISCIPSRKHFFRKNISDYKRWEAEKRRLKALGKCLIRDNNFQMLMSKLKQLSTFAEVNKWDKEAESELSKINSQLQQLDSEIARCQQLFCSSRLQQVLLKWTLKQINHSYKFPLENMANELQKAIDFTPNSLDEKKELLKELKTRKKELQLQKREVAANMKAIRREARTKSANAGRRLYGYNSKIAARERRGIRYRKEAQLRPHEDLVTAIERQLLQIDKDIFWAESIGK